MNSWVIRMTKSQYKLLTLMTVLNLISQQPPTVNVVPASVATAASDSGVAGAGGNSHSDDDDESMLSDDDIASKFKQSY